MLWRTKWMACSLMLEKVAFSRSLIMWLGTLNSPAISLRFIFWVSRNCASSGEMVIAL